MPKSISTGDTMPEFSLPDQNGHIFNIAEYLGKQPMVIFFYPKDETPGCTKEACSFRDNFSFFQEAGVLVIGISSDSSASHKSFAEKHRLPFVLLSDAGGKVRHKLGVPTDLLGLLPGRVTYTVNKEGVVCQVFKSQFAVEKHAAEALKSLGVG